MIKKKSKVSPNFNMSSLTDIIFLLLIFFMLTSSMVVPNALNLQLPGKKSSVPKTKSTPVAIKIERNGRITFNGTRKSLASLEKEIRQLKRTKKRDALVSVSPHAKSSNVDLVAVLDMLYRYEVKAILSDPRQ